MASVTLPGSSGTAVTVQSGTGDNTFVAQIIANTILLASVAGSLSGAGDTQEITINGGATTAPSAPSDGNEHLLYLVGSGGGSLTIPGGWNYVIDMMTGPETISAVGAQVISTDPFSSTFTFTGATSVAADPGTDNDVVTVISGAGFNVGTGDGNDTVTAIGSGTVAGGTGTNTFTITPSVGGSGIRLQSNGAADTVTVNDVAGSVATVVGSGTSLNLMANGAGTVDAQILGNDATVTGGPGTLDVSTGGADAAVFGGTGALSVVDSGTSDTIGALGATGVTVSAFGTDGLIFGGANSLTASLGGVSAQGHNTLRGGVGNVAVTISGSFNDAFGGTGSLTADETGTNDLVAAENAATANVTLGGSNNSVVAGAFATAVTSSGSGGVIMGGSGALSVYDNGTSDTIGAFGASVVNATLNGGGSQGSGDLLIGGTNNINVDMANAFQTVIGGASATNVTVDDIGIQTHENILAGTGSLTVNDQGWQDTIGSFGASPTNVTLGGTDNLLFASSGTTDVSVSGTADTVMGSSGPLTVTASSAAILFGGSGPLSFVGGSAASTIAGGTNATSAVTVGSGGVVFFAGSGSTTSIDGAGGAGATTLFGGSNSSMFFSGGPSGGLVFTAGVGNETLNASASSSNNTYGAGTLPTQNDTIIGGLGSDTFFAGAGTDSFVGGTNADAFAFFESVTSANLTGAHDTITGWTTSDSLFLSGYGNSQTAESVFNAGTVASGSLTITLSDNTTITFENVSSTSEFNGRVLYS